MTITACSPILLLQLATAPVLTVGAHPELDETPRW